jgi:hypothetical protein
MFAWQQGVKRTQWCLHATDDQMGGACLMCNGVYRLMKRMYIQNEETSEIQNESGIARWVVMTIASAFHIITRRCGRQAASLDSSVSSRSLYLYCISLSESRYAIVPT